MDEISRTEHNSARCSLDSLTRRVPSNLVYLPAAAAAGASSWFVVVVAVVRSTDHKPVDADDKRRVAGPAAVCTREITAAWRPGSGPAGPASPPAACSRRFIGHWQRRRCRLVESRAADRPSRPSDGLGPAARRPRARKIGWSRCVLVVRLATINASRCVGNVDVTSRWNWARSRSVDGSTRPRPVRIKSAFVLTAFHGPAGSRGTNHRKVSQLLKIFEIRFNDQNTDVM